MRSALKKALKELANELTTKQLSTFGRALVDYALGHQETKMPCFVRGIFFYGLGYPIFSKITPSKMNTTPNQRIGILGSPKTRTPIVKVPTAPIEVHMA